MLKSEKIDVYNIGIEAIHRGIRPWEHPSFGGVNPKYHIANSKHGRGEAVDLNVFNETQATEDKIFDNLNLELIDRQFGTIWNRQKYPGDHEFHLHVESLTPAQYRYPSRYFYLPRYNTKNKRHLFHFSLAIDGAWGSGTTKAIQRWLFVPETGNMDSRTAKALQAFLNTETRGRLVIDGKFGKKSISTLQRYLGTPVTGGYSRRGSTMVKAMQSRMNKMSHL